MRAFACSSLLLALASAPAARAELPSGRGVLLPLQDRVGVSELTELAETLLRRELETQADLAETETVRAVLRSMRVRDASNEPPDRLAAVAERLGADWFFIATLHEAKAGREPRREDGGPLEGSQFDDAGDTPQLVISARVLRSHSPKLWWAGFDGASGRDGEWAFGLGKIESLAELMRGVVSGIVEAAVETREPRRRTRLRSGKGGYLRSPGGPDPPETVAVIPMDSVADLDPGASAEVATAALYAALEDFGFKTLLPGFVRAIREDTGPIQHGGASRAEWQALASEGEADWVATGTVETYLRGHGRTPSPRVAFSVRFLDAGDGRIGWSHGGDLAGEDTAAVFDRGRIYSTGDLTYEMMRSLLGDLRAGAKTAGTTRRD